MLYPYLVRDFSSASSFLEKWLGTKQIKIKARPNNKLLKYWNKMSPLKIENVIWKTVWHHVSEKGLVFLIFLQVIDKNAYFDQQCCNKRHCNLLYLNWYSLSVWLIVYSFEWESTRNVRLNWTVTIINSLSSTFVEIKCWCFEPNVNTREGLCFN